MKELNKELDEVWKVGRKVNTKIHALEREFNV